MIASRRHWYKKKKKTNGSGQKTPARPSKQKKKKPEKTTRSVSIAETGCRGANNNTKNGGSHQRGLSGHVRLFRMLSRLRRRFGQLETGEDRLRRITGRPSRVIVPHFDHPVLGRPAALPPEQRVQRVVLAVRRVVALDVLAAFRRQHRLVTPFLKAVGYQTNVKRSEPHWEPSGKT